MLRLAEIYSEIPAVVLMLEVIATAEELINLKQVGFRRADYLLRNMSDSKESSSYKSLVKRIVDEAILNFDCSKNSETYHFSQDIKSVAFVTRECVKSYLKYVSIKNGHKAG